MAECRYVAEPSEYTESTWEVWDQHQEYIPDVGLSEDGAKNRAAEYNREEGFPECYWS